MVDFMSQADVLDLMEKNMGKTYTIKELSNALEINLSSTSRAVIKLESQGLIKCLNPKYRLRCGEVKLVTVHCANCGKTIPARKIKNHRKCEK